MSRGSGAVVRAVLAVARQMMGRWVLAMGEPPCAGDWWRVKGVVGDVGRGLIWWLKC